MAHLGPLTKRFFWVMLAAIVAVTALGAMLLAATGTPPPAFSAAIPVAIAGFDAGRQIKRRVPDGLSASDGLLMALVFLLVNIVTSLVIAVGALVSADLLSDFMAAGVGDLIGPLIGFAALYFLLIRTMMWLGGRTAS